MTHQSLDLTCNMEMMFLSIKTLNCLVVWNMNFYEFPYIYIHTWNNHPNWRTHIFQRGSNHQLILVLYIWHPISLQFRVGFSRRTVAKIFLTRWSRFLRPSGRCDATLRHQRRSACEFHETWINVGNKSNKLGCFMFVEHCFPTLLDCMLIHVNPIKYGIL